MIRAGGSRGFGVKTRRVGDLSIDDDPGFQQHEWRVQRLGWIAALVVLLAAALGLFGGDILSQATAGEGGLVVEYDRFIRFGAPTTLLLRLSPEAVADGAVGVWLDDY